MYSIKNKIIAIMLIMVICVGNFAFVLENISTTYATNTNLEAQSIATNNENVEFDTYFMKEAQKVHTFSQNMADKATFYIDIDVKKTGYLKEATIEIDANFKVDENYNQEGILKIENNKIELNQINGNSDKTTIALPIYFDVSKKVNISDFSRQNEATIKATYIDDEAKEHKIEKTIVNKLIWVANPEVQMEEKIEKYAPYNTEEHTGIIVEQRINAQIKDGVLPIAESNIEISVPKIQNIMPQINIRKEGNTNLLENEWTYNKETGKLIIKETNLPNEQGQIDWITKEEYIITYRFENASMQEEQIFTTKASSNIQVYNGETKNLTAKMQKENKLTETIGQIIEINTKINEEKLSKGYLYTNLENTEKLEIPFITNYAINISYKDVADQIILNTNQEQWNMQNQKELVNTYIKNISITRENFKNILGEEGNIVILANNKEIAKVKLPNEETDEIKLDLSEHNLSAITIKVSRPQTEGILNITANKAIKQANTMTKEQIQNISKLETSANIQVIKKENTIMQDAKTAEVTVVEPTSKINVQISKNQLSTVVEKEEVEIKATLKTNSEYDSLYKNPTIDIKLPTEIQNVEILGVELLYEEELKIRNTQLIDGTNKIIRVELTGNQTKYSQNEISTGATVVIRANITLDNLTPTKTEKIEVIYTNQKSTQYENATAEGTGINQIQIKYIAPTGLVPVNTISNYAENKQTRSIAGSNEQGMLEVSSEARIATSEIQLINNYNNKINNIRILGRTLTTGTTDIATNTDLKNTFDAIMVNEIVSEQISQDKYTVYYSENGKATQDLENTENAWTTQPENLSNVKSYLIVLSDYEMNTGDSIKFGYQMQIPEGLKYNEKVSSVYTVYFDNIQEEQTIQDTLLASGLSLTTGEAPELEVVLESYTQENTKVREGQYVKYKAKLKNTGSMDAQNVSINVSAPSGNIYYYIENGKINYVDNLNGKEGKQVATYKTKHTQFVEEDFACEYEDQEEINKNIAVGNLKAGESKEIEYELKIEEFELIKKNLPAENGKLVSPEVKMSSKVEVIADKMKKPITSNEYTVVLDEGKIQVEASSDKTSDYTLTKGSSLTYTARVQNIGTDASLKGLEVTIKVPEELKIKQATTLDRVEDMEDKKVDITTNGNTVIFKMQEYESHDSIDFIVETQVEKDQKTTISPTITAKAEGIEEHTSNVITNKIETLSFSIEQQKLDQEYFKEGEEITYTYKIKNNSQLYVDSFKFENPIPEGTIFKQAGIEFKDGAEAINAIEDNKLVVETEFTEGEEITIMLVVIAGKLQDGQTEKQIENYATIEGNLFEKIESNHISSIIEYDKTVHNTDENEEEVEDDKTEQTPVGNDKYKISGTAWIDENKNGEREENEKTLEGLKVRLVNQQTKETVKDSQTGEEKIVLTSSQGKYTFENLLKGEYIVVFEYNNTEYQLTQYQKEEVSKLINSDVISMKMNIDSAEKTVAVSDTLVIEESNIRNIDIGMYLAAKSDLSLEKYISKVTVTYGGQTKTYDYKNAKIAKVEIPSKNLSQATVVVEYKIVVTNEGDIANYVKKIVDYIPTDMKFNAELNKDWYQSSNGDLYNASLANVKLEPGQSKELSLILNKKLTENSTGNINNNAEIYEVYNEEGIGDIDSVEANKITKEDDMSSADLVISIKTGEIVAFTGIISILICAAIAVMASICGKKMKRFMYMKGRG